MTSDSTKTEVGSYFVSNYPPYSAWNEGGLEDVRQVLQSPPADVPLGLYLHIPFCRKRCKFCYFKVFTENTAGDIEQYVSALSREIELVSKLPVMGDRPFRFVYFGGGTPSFLSPRQLTSLVDRLRANINWDEAEEVYSIGYSMFSGKSTELLLSAICVRSRHVEVQRQGAGL